MSCATQGCTEHVHKRYSVFVALFVYWDMVAYQNVTPETELKCRTTDHPFLPLATKLGQGYIFTGVCHSVNRGVSAPRGSALGGVSAPGGSATRGVSAPGGVWSRGKWSAPGGCLMETPPRTATAAGGTHPTGMHSCLDYMCFKLLELRRAIYKLLCSRRQVQRTSKTLWVSLQNTDIRIIKRTSNTWFPRPLSHSRWIECLVHNLN